MEKAVLAILIVSIFNQAVGAGLLLIFMVWLAAKHYRKNKKA